MRTQGSQAEGAPRVLRRGDPLSAAVRMACAVRRSCVRSGCETRSNRGRRDRSTVHRGARRPRPPWRLRRKQLPSAAASYAVLPSTSPRVVGLEAVRARRTISAGFRHVGALIADCTGEKTDERGVSDESSHRFCDIDHRKQLSRSRLLCGATPPYGRQFTVCGRWVGGFSTISAAR